MVHRYSNDSWNTSAINFKDLTLVSKRVNNDSSKCFGFMLDDSFNSKNISTCFEITRKERKNKTNINSATTLREVLILQHSEMSSKDLKLILNYDGRFDPAEVPYNKNLLHLAVGAIQPDRLFALRYQALPCTMSLAPPRQQSSYVYQPNARVGHLTR